MSEDIKFSEPEFVGDFQVRPVDLEVEEAEEPSKKLGWTCHERHGWEIKVPTADFEQQLGKLETDEEKLALIESLENMTETSVGMKVLVMSLFGWVRGVVREKSDLVSFWHVDAGGSIFPLEMAGDERNCWVTTSQINKKCFNMELKR